MRKIAIVLTLVLQVYTVWAKDFVLENSVTIDASVETVFAAIEDFKNYPSAFPQSNEEVEIISEIKNGVGVQFKAVTKWKSFKTTSIFEVIAYEKNHFIETENKKNSQTRKMIVEKLPDGNTKCTMQTRGDFPSVIKKQLSADFDKELEDFKNFCEKNKRKSIFCPKTRYDKN